MRTQPGEECTARQTPSLASGIAKTDPLRPEADTLPLRSPDQEIPAGLTFISTAASAKNASASTPTSLLPARLLMPFAFTPYRPRTSHNAVSST
ncbi:hypothetical protein [Streptomyces chattanoogensis]|uniref:Uncharacterized protein n=1 Tax=Streptomyces chattanoogensis TaxID=66876 RepID=A0A0N1JX63_9ACTN|nr:hypothetical protein [Streptomyces chattanoogensis]KPC61403.1 hypothetical protein ADL29_24350 [Streptomyces chattanoogensis]